VDLTDEFKEFTVPGYDMENARETVCFELGQAIIDRM